MKKYYKVVSRFFDDGKADAEIKGTVYADKCPDTVSFDCGNYDVLIDFFDNYDDAIAHMYAIYNGEF